MLGAAAQFGIFAAYFGAIALGFNDKAAAAVSIIGGADGPTSIFLAGKLGQTGLMGPIAVAAYSYMALVPIIQPPIIRLLTTKRERRIRMAYKEEKPVSWMARFLFPFMVVLFCRYSGSCFRTAYWRAHVRQYAESIGRCGFSGKYGTE